MNDKLLREIMALRDMAFLEHYEYKGRKWMCGKHPGGLGGECDCGADKHNAEVEKAWINIMKMLMAEHAHIGAAPAFNCGLIHRNIAISPSITVGSVCKENEQEK